MTMTKRAKLREALFEALSSADKAELIELNQAIADYFAQYPLNPKTLPPLFKSLLEAIEDGINVGLTADAE